MPFVEQSFPLLMIISYPFGILNESILEVNIHTTVRLISRMRKTISREQNVNIPTKLFEDVLNQLVGYQLIPSDYKDSPKAKVFQSVKREHIK